MTKIEYNGSIVATVEGGNTATIPIKDKKMKSDIMITVPEAEGDIPEYSEVEGFEVFTSTADEGSLELGYTTPQDVKLSAPSDGVSPERFVNLYDDNFASWNIKSGVSIFGMTGNYEGSPLPIEVSTEVEMTALLESGEVGGVYKYIGESTAVYEKDALYILGKAGYPLTINSAEAYNMGDDTVAYFKINGSASETDYDFKFDGLERSYTFANIEGTAISLPLTISDVHTLGILCEYGSVTLADTNTNAELIYVSAWNDVNNGELSLDADTSVNIQYDFCD